MRKALILAVALAIAGPAVAADIGLIKVSSGDVQIQRGTNKLPATVGAGLQTQDVIVTGANGSARITFSDNTLVSICANSIFAIEQYQIDSTCHAGEIAGHLQHDRLSTV